jgi:DNA-binding MarR family transcriptional regulator
MVKRSVTRHRPQDIDRREARRVMDCLRRVARALQTASRSRSKGAKITGAQLWVLHQIGRTPGISLSQLALQTLTNTSTVSEVTSRLVSTGYLRRNSHATDGRRSHLSLTSRGAAVLRATPPPAQEKLANALLSLSRRDLAQLADLFDEWIAEAGLQRTPASMLDSVARPVRK